MSELGCRSIDAPGSLAPRAAGQMHFCHCTAYGPWCSRDHIGRQSVAALGWFLPSQRENATRLFQLVWTLHAAHAKPRAGALAAHQCRAVLLAWRSLDGEQLIVQALHCQHTASSKNTTCRSKNHHPYARKRRGVSSSLHNEHVGI